MKDPENTSQETNQENIDEINQNQEEIQENIQDNNQEQNQEQNQEINNTEQDNTVNDNNAYKELENNYNTLKTQVAEMTETIKIEKINNTIKELARDNGITKEQLPYVVKLINFDDVYDNGVVNSEKIKKEIDDFSSLFRINQSLGIKTDDNNERDTTNKSEEMSKMEKNIRKAMGR